MITFLYNKNRCDKPLNTCKIQNTHFNVKCCPGLLISAIYRAQAAAVDGMRVIGAYEHESVNAFVKRTVGRLFNRLIKRSTIKSDLLSFGVLHKKGFVKGTL